MARAVKPTRLRATAGALALASAGYASAIGLARRPPGQVPDRALIEATLDRWLAELGASGRHHYLVTPVGRVHVVELGQGSQTLIFLHGLGASVGEYFGLLTELARHYRVIGIDRPGSGLSDPVRFSGHPRPAWNQVVMAVAAALGVTRFDVVGHSLGGLAAGGFAVDHPEQVRHLVLLSPVGLSRQLPWFWALAMVPGMTDWINVASRLAMARQSRDIAAVPGAGWGPVRIGSDLASYRYQVGLRFGRGSDFELIPRLMRPFAFRPETLLLPALNALADRTVVVWGARDDQVALAPARQQLQGYPAIRLEVLPEAGHLFPFEDPVLTAQLVSAWLAG